MKYLNFRETYNKTLLEIFYNDFVKARFLYDQRRFEKDVKKFEKLANVSGSDHNDGRLAKEKLEEQTNVILLLDDTVVNKDNLIGGIVFDYFSRVNQALIRCVVVDENERKEEYCKGLLDEAFHSITLFCKETGHELGVKHVYLEMQKAGAQHESDISNMQTIFHKLGFCLVDIDYHTLLFSSESKIFSRRLLVHHPASIEINNLRKDDFNNSSLNSEDVSEFYKEYCMHNIDIGTINIEDNHSRFKKFHDHLSSIKVIKICGLIDWKVNKCTQIIVIGAGMAGLAASALLKESGFDIILLEAADYLGGRVKQVKAFEGWPPVDLGGEFIHGSTTVAYRLAVENNWDLEMLFDYNSETEAEWIYLEGQMYPYHSSHPDIEAAYTAWGDLVYHFSQDKTGKTNNEDDIASTKTNIDISAAEYFESHPEFSKKSAHIFNTIFCQTEAATLETYGAQEQADFENSWNCGPGNFRMKNSQDLLKHYLKSCEHVDKRLNWQAKKIDYTEALDRGNPYKITVTNQIGEELRAQAVIVCVPVTILKDQDISFVPELPKDKRLAIERIQMHTGLKIICRFSRRFWPGKIKVVFNCTSDISQLWMYTNYNKETGEECHIVTGFQTAELARQKAHLTADEVKEIFMNDLDEMFADEENAKPASRSFMDYAYYHWSSHPFVRGAYSSPSVHARGSRETLARPVANLVFFSGEATRSGGDSCSVSGAIQSGRRAAEEVKKVLHVRLEKSRNN